MGELLNRLEDDYEVSVSAMPSNMLQNSVSLILFSATDYSYIDFTLPVICML